MTQRGPAKNVPTLKDDGQEGGSDFFSQKKNHFTRRDFKETVLEEKLIPRAPLQDSEPSGAGNAISAVFLVNPLKKHGTREESRGDYREFWADFTKSIWLLSSKSHWILDH